MLPPVSLRPGDAATVTGTGARNAFSSASGDDIVRLAVVYPGAVVLVIARARCLWHAFADHDDVLMDLVVVGGTLGWMFSSDLRQVW